MENVEKFLIDLEVLYHMRRAMPGCVVMGGLAVPFHLDREAARVSIDVDVVTGLDAEGSRLAMDRAFKDMGGTIRDGKPHRPAFQEGPFRSTRTFAATLRPWTPSLGR